MLTRQNFWSKVTMMFKKKIEEKKNGVRFSIGDPPAKPAEQK